MNYNQLTVEERERKGAWWTTDPYSAYVYSSGGHGTMFIATVDKTILDSLAKDVTTESGYENYLFPETDPPEARIVTDDECNNYYIR